MMTGVVPIVRLFGIEIRVPYTWAILLSIVLFIGAQQAAITAPTLAAPVHWLIGVAVAFGFLASVVAHELAHALVGRRRGVPTTVIALGFVGGLAPLTIQASTPRDELAIALAGPARLGAARRRPSSPSACSPGSANLGAHGREPRRPRRAQPHPRRAEPPARACRSTAAGSCGRSPGHARRTATARAPSRRASAGCSGSR